MSQGMHSFQLLHRLDFGDPVNSSHCDSLAAKQSLQILHHRLNIEMQVASEYVNCTIAMFWPGVQTGMGFSQQQKTGKPMRTEFIKAFADDGQPTFPDGLRKQRARAVTIEQ
jgi:hypothetical protein